MMIAKSALRTTLMSLALLLVTFVGGLLAGAAVERTVKSPGERISSRGERDDTPRGRDGPGRDARPPRFLDQIDLSEAQQAEIESILERGKAETREFWMNEGARLREIVEETRADIVAVLTPEQRERFEELRDRRRGGRRGDSRDPQRSSPRNR